MTILPKAIYRFNEIPIKLPWHLFHRTITKKNFNLYGNTKSILIKQNGDGGIRLPDLRLYYKATVIKAVLQWHKKTKRTQKYRSMEQDRKPRNKPMHLSSNHQLMYDKGGKYIQWRKDSLFNKLCWENWTAKFKRMELEHSLTPYTKIN